MRQVAQNYKTGELLVVDVPPPACRPGGVVVRSLYSLISTGTEVMKVTEAGMSLLGKARARPDQVRKLVDSVAQQGVRSTYTKAMQRLDAYTPLGYSLCGVVVEVGAGVDDLHVGQVVASGGSEHALHAELNWVPRNLCVPVPAGVDPRLAAFATVGAIAMHGVRRAEPQLGEAACVVGLGLVGQLVVQLLVAAGVQVAGLDVVPDRCRLAEKAGAFACEGPDAEGLDRVERALRERTGGLGADCILLVAGGSSNGPVQAAARLARDRARVVDIGKLKLDLPWNAYYDKELDVRFSRSYGPGRYDDTYELDGVDYPAGYVRWTERRNLECFVDLLARGALAVDLLASEAFPLSTAPQVYARLAEGALEGIGFLFEYPLSGTPQDGTVPAGATRQPATAAGAAAAPVATASMAVSAATTPAAAPQAADGRVRLGFVGAGNYASSMLLPHLTGRPDVELACVATQSSLSAATAQRRFGFSAATTEVTEVLASDVDAVFVVTRHHDHADLVCRALQAGKAVFVEKPLAVHREELERVVDVVRTTGNDRLMVGFNRRFAPLLVDLRRRFGEPSGGGLFRYLVNAGPLASTSWYLDEQREGSRFVGEGGHFLDTMGWWLGATPEVVEAVGSTGGDLHVTVRYSDGSLGTVDYAVQGNPKYPKETFEASSDGRSARFENFVRATVWRGRRRSVRRAVGGRQKGQEQQLARFVDAVRTGGPMPVPMGSLVATTAATLAVERSLRLGEPVEL